MKFSLTATPHTTPSAPLLMQGDLHRAFRLASEWGYDGVELFLRHPSDVDAEALIGFKKRYGLETPALGTGMATREDNLTFADPDPERRSLAVDRFVQFVPLAARLEAALTIGLLTGFLGPDPQQRPVRRANALRCLEESCASAASQGVPVLLEPLHRCQSDWVCTVEDALGLIEELGAPNLQVLADTFHMNIEEVSIEESLRRATPRLGLVHLADSNKRAPGFGHLDFPRLLSTLQESGYEGFVSFEVLPWPTAEEAARAAIQTVRGLLASEAE